MRFGIVQEGSANATGLVTKIAPPTSADTNAATTRLLQLIANLLEIACGHMLSVVRRCPPWAQLLIVAPASDRTAASITDALPKFGRGDTDPAAMPALL